MQARRVYIYQCNWIKPPHPKIFLCVDGTKKWGFFFNSEPRNYGIGQLECYKDDSMGALSKTCYLDLTGLKSLSPAEVERATEYEEISKRLYDCLIIELTNGNDLLSDAHRLVALNGLQLD